MPSRLRKTQKLQGHVSHSHRCRDKYQKHPEDLGSACGMHHCRINLDKYHPGFFGNEQTRINAAQNKTGAAPMTDVVRLGHYKVWGKGKLPKQPVIMKVKSFTRRVEEKTKIGVVVVLLAI
uniref:Large ribosomal subunit protein uL15 n=1 Tax=Ursus maritimus TaxID=29073 RepID=A0A452TQV2_URSMA